MIVISIPLNDRIHLIRSSVIAAVDMAYPANTYGDIGYDLSTGRIIYLKSKEEHARDVEIANSAVTEILRHLLFLCISVESFDLEDVFNNGFFDAALAGARSSSPALAPVVNVINNWAQCEIYEDIDVDNALGLSSATEFVMGLLDISAHIASSIERIFGYRSLMSGRSKPAVKITWLEVSNADCCIAVDTC